MKKKETIRSLWTPTTKGLCGVRRVAMLLLVTLLLSMTATAQDECPESNIVTQDNFNNFFNEDGTLKNAVTYEELIFKGEFTDLVSYIVLDSPITITGDNADKAVLNNMGFVIASENVTLDKMTLTATTSLGSLITVMESNVTITNLDISYIVGDEEAIAIDVRDVGGTLSDINISKNNIYFESHVSDDERYATAINLEDVEDVIVDGNIIVASMPALYVETYDYTYFMMGLCNVNPVRVYESNSVELTNNKIDVTVNSYAESYPVVQALYIVGSEDIHVEENDFKMVDEITPEGTPIYLYAVECGFSEGIEFNKNNFDISTKGGQSGIGSVYVLQFATTAATFTGNNITCQSNGPIVGIFSPYGFGPAKDLIIKKNILDITGNATGSSDFALISGIEIQTGYATISNNTIYVQNKGGYDDTYPVSGISAAQYSAITLSFDIQNNEVYVPDGKYAVDIRYAPQNAKVIGNALCAHKLTGDDAVYIKSGDNNTVENNLLGYVIPKTGESTYNIPANVPSFKVYDDGGMGRTYSPGCDGTLTLTAPDGYWLQLLGTIKSEKDVDYLTVYDGSSNLADVLIDQVSSSASGELTDIPTVTSTGQSITFYFHSDNSNSENSEFDGLDLTVTLIPAAVNITNGVGDVITADDEITVPTLDYIRSLSAPGATPDATVGDVDVNVYTLCLPYAPATGEGIKYYTLSGSTGSTLQFTEIDGDPEANTPYLVTVSSTALSVGTTAQLTNVPLKKEVTNSVTAGDYIFKGTTIGLTNAEAVAEGAYILMAGNQWGQVQAATSEHPEYGNAYIPPFRAYIVSTSGARSLDNEFSDGDATGIQSLQLIDRDGSEQWFDLSGRRIEKPTKKGLYIVNGKKVVKR